MTDPAPAAHPCLAELVALIESGQVDTVMLAFTDMQGRLMGKRAHGKGVIDGLVDHGMHMCTYLLGTDMEMNTPPGFGLMSWETGYGDWLGAPDWDTLRVLPWQDRTALVLCDVLDEQTHEEVPISPRSILKRQLAKAREMGVAIKAASEFEYYLLADTYSDAHRKGYVEVEPFGHYNEDYHLLAPTRADAVHGRLRRLMSEARVPVEFSKGEAGVGQHEINLAYAPALESADRSVIFKHGAKEIADAEGLGLTFMAKPDRDWTGSSGHLHLSAWGVSDDMPRFPEPGSGDQMSDTMRWFLGGMLAHSRGLAPFFAPNVNSYKRYAEGSWAPINICWARDNRSAGFRVIGRDASLRIECRFPGGDMNAYLTYAAFIGAGLLGLQERIEPPPELVGNGYLASDVERLPRALHEAIRYLESSQAARDIFGPDVVDHYLTAARVEQAAYDAHVHAWDRERYLERA